MRKITIFAISLGLTFMFFLSGVVHADTFVSSNIITDTIWTKAGNTYLVTQSIDVYPNVKLTIESGVEVKFYKGCDLEIYGELIAIGTESEMIIFDHAQALVLKGDAWGGIIFKEGSIGTTDDGNGNYVSGSIIKYCRLYIGKGIKNKNTGINLHIINNEITYNEDTGIINYGDSLITDNQISYCAGGCEGSASATTRFGGGIHNEGKSIITNNTLTHNTGCNGGGIYNKGSNTLITDNIINDNSASVNGGGIFNDATSCTISKNTLNNNLAGYNGGGICSFADETIITHNKITGNSTSNYYGGGVYNGGSHSIISNNELYNNSTNVNGTIATHSSSFVMIVDNNLENNSGQGISNRYGDDVTINKNLIIDNNGSGIVDNNSDNVVVSNNVITNVTGQGITATNSSSSIINNKVTGSSQEGISGGRLIKNNMVTYNGKDGITVLQNCTIEQNIITNNSGCGIRSNYWDATIRKNIITDNSCGIYNAGFSSIEGNEISSNLSYGIDTVALSSFQCNNIYNNGTYDFHYTDIPDQMAINNYWGTTNSTEIMDHIYDYWDDITRGKVIFEPFATTPYVIRVGADKAMPWIPLLLLGE